MSSSSTLVSEVAPAVANHNTVDAVVWKYQELASLELYRTVWWAEVADPRCRCTRAIIRDGIFKFNYVTIVHCLTCYPCKQWIETFTIVEGFMVCAVEAAKTELQKGLITEEEIREIFDA